MRYLSTRGHAPVLDFEAVVLAGLASDGGLYVPENFPQVTPQQLASWRSLSYTGLALEVMHPYVGNALTRDELKSLIDGAYASFRHSAIAPLKQLGDDQWLLELFHGPTLAFKDFALQLLGPMVDFFLKRADQKVVVVGATSGDTGSAALAGMRGRARIQSFILFPHGRVSDVQRRQMTTMTDVNIHNIAVEGTFDDCQDIVKSLFADAAFRNAHNLVAVNSINWARILAQVVYYFYAALRLGAPSQAVSFCVPTGNFGDIYAGYVAKQMGLPIDRLIIASNRNNILTRGLNTGTYKMQGVQPSLSPSMDIQISSNFERLLFDLYGRDAPALEGAMIDLRTSGSQTLSAAAWAGLKQDFDAHCVEDDETLQTIRRIYDQTGELLDPHTAVGIASAQACNTRTPLVTLATAHPAKFPDAVKQASSIHPALPPHLANLFDLPERFDILPNARDAVASYIESQKI